MLYCIKNKHREAGSLNYFLLAVATLSASGKAIFCKLVGSAKGRRAFFVNFESFSVAFLVSLIFAADELKNISEISLFSVLLAVAFGFSVAFTQFTQMKAMNTGSPSLTTLIYSSAFLIPIVFSYFAWDNPISPWQIVGIVILIAALCLIIIEPGKKRAGKIWLIFTALATLGSGANAILQKTHQNSTHSSEIKLFLVLALLFSALFSLILYLISKPDEKAPKKEKASLPALLSPILLGVTVAFLNFVNLKLAGVLPAAIQFPIYNVGSLILTSIVSVICFGEHLAKRKIIGYTVGIGAILMVGLL